MRRTQFAIGHARGDADELHIGVGIGEVCLDLFQRATGQKTGCAADEGKLTAIGKAGADAHHVLFGNADIDEALGEFRLEAAELRGAD
ncbi:hypothetical protein D3C87_2026680 [compost metagenome]